MTVDIKDLLAGKTSELKLDFTFRPELGPEPPVALAGVVFPEDSHASGRIAGPAGCLRLTLSVTVPWQGECARCLSPVSDTLELGVERTVAEKGTLSNEEEIADYSDEYLIAERGMLDLTPSLSDAIICGFPEKVLCSPDCPGLCPVCGKPLAEGDCGCKKDTHDPRWDVLRTMRFPDEEPGENQ